MQIRVTEKHIAEGVPCEYACCPIALALSDQGHTDTTVLNDIVYVNDADCTTAYELPDIAVDFIRNFDSGKKVKPFTFELEEE